MRIFLKNHHVMIIVLLLGAAIIALNPPPIVAPPGKEGEFPQIGYRAPDFSLETVAGGEYRLSEFRDRVVLVNFWATWCGPCKAEMPSMESLYKDLNESGFEILAVSVDFEGEAAVRPFLETLSVSYPVLLDQDLIVQEKYLVHTIPTSILVDERGVILHKFVGERDWNDDQMRNLIGSLTRS